MRMKSILLTGAMLFAAPALAAAPTPAPTPVPVAPAIDIQTARDAVAHSDFNRLISDRAYAAQMLAYLDRLAAVPTDNVEISLNLDMLRLFPLATLERSDEIRTVVDRMIERRPNRAALYGGPLYATLAITDVGRAVAVVETASRNVPASGWADLRTLFTQGSIRPLLSQLHANHDEATRGRLARALFRIGWPGAGDTETSDFLRMILVDDSLSHDDSAGAADYAAGITTPGAIVPMIVNSRYDRVLAPGEDRVELLRHALEERDRASAAALAAAPAGMQAVLDRTDYLRAVGRDAEAYALLQPFTRDLRATIGAGDKGVSLVSQSAYALSALGRDAEALRLMDRVAALAVESNSTLIVAFMSRIDIFISAGRYADALAWSQRLDRDYSHFASDYGKRWIVAGIVCSLAGLNRNAEAAPQLERLRAGDEANLAALTLAYLCVGDSDAAAAVLVRRLQSSDPKSALLALQDYRIAERRDPMAPVVDRLLALRDRPAVRDALGRVGRILPLPVTRSYGGSF